MVKGYSYIYNDSSVEEACRSLILHYFKDEIPTKLLAFVDFKKIIEEVLYCEIIEANDRVIFITEDLLEEMTLL